MTRADVFSLAGPAGAIETRLEFGDDTAAAPAAFGVVCHPHPLFGGTMDNKVVQTLARAFVQCGYTAVRFNFRGVGASAGEHDAGVGEAQDMLSVVRQVAPEGPIALAGFSFGAFVTSHVLAGLWNEGRVEKAVLVGTAASRFTVAPVPPEAHDRTLVVHGEQDFGVTLDSGRFSAAYWAYVNGCDTTQMETTGYPQCTVYRGCPRDKAWRFLERCFRRRTVITCERWPVGPQSC